MIVSGLLLFLLVADGGCVPKLLFTQLMVYPGGGYVNYVKLGENEVIESCVFRYAFNQSQITVSIDMKNEGKQEGKGLEEQLYSLGQNLCGVKIIDVTVDDPITYTIAIDYTDDSGKRQPWESSYGIRFNDLTAQEEVRNVSLGQATTIDCGDHFDAVMCLLLNPGGEKVVKWEKSCKYNVDHVSREDLGKWRCFTSFPFKMDPFEEFVELRELAPENYQVKTWYREEDGLGILGCQLRDETTHKPIDAEFCNLFRPDGQMFVLTAAAATERYTTVGLDLDQSLCQLEFPLPILPEERGIWKCLIGDTTGGFINSNSGEELRYTERRSMAVRPDFKLQVRCEIPYQTDDCYIESPTGVLYPGGTDRTFWMGECRMADAVKVNYSLHLGEWKCRYSSPDKSLDDVVTVEVRSPDTFVTSFGEVEVDEGQGVTLMCRLGYPIHYCRFEGPKGAVFYVSKDKEPRDGFGYVGEGLEHGDCGLSIEKVRTEHHGNWTCAVRNRYPRNGTDDAELKNYINVIVDASFLGVSTSSAAVTIAVPVVVVALAIVFVAAAMYMKYGKKRRSTEARSSRESGENVVFSRELSHVATYSGTQESE